MLLTVQPTHHVMAALPHQMMNTQLVVSSSGYLLEWICNAQNKEELFLRSLQTIQRVYFFSVCNVGLYWTGSACELCAGNEIKSTPGDATNCSADAPCDGVTSVPNDDHSACGEFRINKEYTFA